MPTLSENSRTLVSGDTVIHFSAYSPDKQVKVKSLAFYHYVHGNQLGKAQAAYIGRLLHGPYQLYTRTKHLVGQGQFEQGLKSGTWYYWHNNGIIARKEIYKEGYAAGKWEAFRSDGSLESVQSFRKGLLHGSWRTYYPNGILSSEYRYQEAELAGKFAEFYANGKPKQKGTYKNGQLHGKLTTFDEAGKATTIKYRKGEKIIPKQKNKDAGGDEDELNKQGNLFRKIFPAKDELSKVAEKQENQPAKLRENQRVLRWWPFHKQEKE